MCGAGTGGVSPAGAGYSGGTGASASGGGGGGCASSTRDRNGGSGPGSGLRLDQGRMGLAQTLGLGAGVLGLSTARRRPLAGGAMRNPQWGSDLCSGRVGLLTWIRSTAHHKTQIIRQSSVFLEKSLRSVQLAAGGSGGHPNSGRLNSSSQ